MQEDVLHLVVAHPGFDSTRSLAYPQWHEIAHGKGEADFLFRFP